ncbi:MAG: 6-hydroxymethylpterin diphosphokinase MptE-like protein [Anaerolineales bacterium]
MASSRRLRPSELTPSRIAAALARRVADIPHAMAWSFSREARANRDRLATFRNMHQDARCVVIANGPSLGRMDLSSLRREITFGLNRIYLNFRSMGFGTSYYVSINELVLEQFGAEIAGLQMAKFLNWNRRAIVHKGSPGVHYLRMKLGLNDDFSRDITLPMSSGGTVTFVALQLAYLMGFRKVVLIGLDHRFSSAGTPNQTELRENVEDRDHFHPNYFPAGSRWQLPDLRRSELAYALARQAFEADGREILDATVDGSCPVFEKTDFSKLFK